MGRGKGAGTVVGTRIRALRLAKGWSQVQLGGRVGVARSTISAIESGLDTPSFQRLYDFARVLGVPPAALLLDPRGRSREAVAYAALTGSDELAEQVAEAIGTYK